MKKFNLSNLDTNDLCDTEKTYDFVFFTDIQLGNPNGDADTNEPRLLSDGKTGWITDVSTKYKLRRYIENKIGKDSIHVRPGVYATDLTKDLTEEEIKTKFLDTKFFGDVITQCQEEVKDTKGNIKRVPLKALGITGSIQLSFGISCFPIECKNISITRCAQVTEKTKNSKNTNNDMDSENIEIKDANEDINVRGTFGNKNIVEYGCYKFAGRYNSSLGKENLVSKDDLKLFWESLMFFGNTDHSAARFDYSTKKLYVFKHNNNLTQSMFRKAIKVTLKNNNCEPKEWDDVVVEIDDELLSKIEALNIEVFEYNLNEL